MQQEAIRRVKEMHMRSQQYINSPQQSNDTQANSIPVHNNNRQSAQSNNTGNQSQQNTHHNNNSPSQAGNTTYINRNNINNPHSNTSGNNNNKQQENSQNHQQKQTQQQNNHGNQQTTNNQQSANNQMHRNNQQYNAGNPFSQLFGSNLGGFSKFKQMFSPQPPKKPAENSPDDNDKEKKPLDGLLDGIFKDFEIDNEKIMLGILIYLLYKNGSDVKLLLALGYLLL